MSLPPPVARQEIHQRHLEMRGYARDDGWFDIEGHLVDTKSQAFQVTAGARVDAGAPIHGMWVRLTLDQAYVVRDIAAATDAAPYGDCHDAPPTLSALIGASVSGGWRKSIQQRLGGAASCTHLREMLGPMGTVAFQTMLAPLRARGLRADGPVAIDSCYAFAAHREIAMQRWPQTPPAPAAPTKDSTDEHQP